KKRVPKADASPPIPVTHSPPRPVNVKDHQNWIPQDICHSPKTILMNSNSKNNVGDVMHISSTECQKVDVTPIVDFVIPILLLKAKVIDYSIWEVIENGNAPPITKVVEGVETIISPTTVEEKAQRSTINTNGAVNTAHGATTASTQATTVNSTTINSLSDAVICLGYNAVPPPYTGNFMPPKPDLSFSSLEDFTSEPIVIKPIVENSEAKASEQSLKKLGRIIVDCKKNMVPRAVLMKSGLVSVNTARQVNAAHSKTTVNAARPMSYLSKTAHSTVKRPIHKNTTFKNSNFDQRVNTIKDKNVNTVRPKAVVNAAKPKEVVNAARPKAVVNVVKGNNVNAVKASSCWV
ncbi:hypothetical protein Tco_0291627, partial [Tanacetum coccineum]